MGFEPTQFSLVELESTPLDHSGKLSLAACAAQATVKHISCRVREVIQTFAAMGEVRQCWDYVYIKDFKEFKEGHGGRKSCNGHALLNPHWTNGQREMTPPQLRPRQPRLEMAWGLESHVMQEFLALIKAQWI